VSEKRIESGYVKISYNFTDGKYTQQPIYCDEFYEDFHGQPVGLFALLSLDQKEKVLNIDEAVSFGPTSNNTETGV